jgi:hypothetical protein
MAADKDITILQGSAFNVPVRWMDGDRIIRRGACFSLHARKK